MDLDKIFYELLRVAIGNQDFLSRLPSNEEWEKLYDMAKKHSLLGVCFAGLQHLGADVGGGFTRIGICENLYLTWMGIAAKIKQKNERINFQCADLQRRLSDDGFKSCILKGQGIAQLYNEQLRGLRQPGDIDIWVDGDRDKALTWVRLQGGNVSFIDSVHAHADLYKDTEVELHSRPSWMYCSRGDKAFYKYWVAHKDEQMMHMDELVRFSYPTVEFNLVHSLLHINRHIFEEGIGFRQLMDYYFILKASTEADRMRAKLVLKSMNLYRFACGIMYIEQTVFGLESTNMLWLPNEHEGKFLLKDILTGGNFGRYDPKTKTYRLDERWKRGCFSIRHNLRYLMHYPSEVLSIPMWKVKHYLWRKKKGYI